MKRILVTGAGGAPAINFIRSLRSAPEEYYLIGADCNKYYLQRSTCDENHLVPRADDDRYLPVVRDLIANSGAKFLHTQNDIEIGVISRNRDGLGLRLFLPAIETVSICLDKLETHKRWAAAGLPQPRTMLINSEADLRHALDELGPTIWLRDIAGAAGKGSLPTDNLRIATAWLEFKSGWGFFTAAECLSPTSITWQSIWKDGHLIVAQGRKRLYWEFADRAPSGITGLTGTGVTVSDPQIDKLAQEAIFAIDPTPHGIFSVDMTYDREGQPHPTEINIGRFFTTHEFFTSAGLNMPHIYVKLAYGEDVTLPTPHINPLPPDLAWIRGMDVIPILTTVPDIEVCVEDLHQRLERLGLS